MDGWTRQGSIFSKRAMREPSSERSIATAGARSAKQIEPTEVYGGGNGGHEGGIGGDGCGEGATGGEHGDGGLRDIAGLG